MAYQRLSQEMNRTHFRVVGIKFPPSYQVNVVKVSLSLAIPALGYTTLSVCPTAAGQRGRQPTTPGLATGERSMANEFLAVTIQSNGALTVTDWRNGEVYRDWLFFEDSSDIGDGWNYAAAANDQTFVSSAGQSSIALVYNGPLQTTFCIRTPMTLPAEFDFAAKRRSERMTELVIESLVTLRAGSGRLEVETTVHNNAGDHRLRVLFPSGVQADTWLADTPFDVVERPVALRPDNHLYREPELETKPQQSWSAVFAAGRGLAVISSGLLETAVRDLPAQPLALTLFRSTRRTVMTAGEPGGQLFGDLTFRYWITPLAGEPDRAALCRMGHELAGGAARRAANSEGYCALPAGSIQRGQASCRENLPFEAGFVSVEGDVVVTSLRRVEEGLEVRLFNPNITAAAASIQVLPGLAWVKAPAHACLVDFESNLLSEIDGFDGKTVPLTVNPKQILTVRLE